MTQDYYCVHKLIFISSTVSLGFHSAPINSTYTVYTIWYEIVLENKFLLTVSRENAGHTIPNSFLLTPAISIKYKVPQLLAILSH